MLRKVVLLFIVITLVAGPKQAFAGGIPSVRVNTVLCGTGCNGKAIAIVNNSSSTTGYTYKWKDGTTGATDTGLCVGSNWVIVQDTGVGGGTDTAYFTLSSGVHITPVTSAYSCAYKCDGTAAVYLPNISGVTYSWYIGGTPKKNVTSNSVPKVCPGHDTVTINIPGCPSTDVYFYIPPPPILVATVLYIIPSTCANACNGRAYVSASGGDGNYTITWSDGNAGNLDTALCYGTTYSVTVSDAGCYSTTVKLKLPPPVFHKIVAHVAVDLSACTCSSSASVVSIDNAGSPFKYKWSRFGETTAGIHSLCPGTYTVIASGVCGSDTETVTIPSVKAIVSVFTTPACHCNGTATATLLYGGPKVKYRWSTGDTTKTIKGLCTGSYTVWASSPCGTDSTTFIIKAPTHMRYLDKKQLNVTCPGACNVIESVNDTGGLRPYHYLWSNGDTSYTGTKLCDGSIYYVKVWDNCGDTALDTVLIHVTKHKPSGSFVVLQSCCRGTCNGSASVAGKNGVAPYTYRWKRGDSTSVATGLCPDSTYIVYITDTCGVKDTFSFRFPPPSNMTASFTNTNNTCPGLCTGEGYITVSGGIGPYKYSWSNGNKTYSSKGLCIDTLYLVTITDSCGDTIVYRFKFPYPSKMSINMGHSPTCKGHCVGAAYAYLSGGLKPYSYTWNTGDTTYDVRNACYGKVYKVSVKDLCGTTLTDTISVPLAAPLFSSISLGTPPCPGKCSGTAYVTTSGGIPPFYYTWSNGNTTSTATTLCGDSTYTVYIDDPGCIVDTLSIKIPKPTPLSDSVLSFSPSCPANCNGEATVKAYGGAPPYTYKWSNGFKISSISGLCAGKYYVLVSDKCLKSDTLHITIPLVKISIDTLIHINNPCYGKCIAKIAVKGTGGKTPYKYLWSNGDTAYIDSSLCNGRYSVVVYDSGCAYDTAYFTVKSPPQFKDSLTVTKAAICNGYCNGKAFVMASGGAKPIKYQWETGDTLSFDTSLCPGYQYVIVSDSGCVIDTIHFNVPAVSILNLTPPVSIAAKCHDSCNGIIYVKLPTGGYPPYSYHWDNGKDSASIHNVCGGINILLVKDSLGCFLYDTVNVLKPAEVKIMVDTFPSHCFNKDGRLTIVSTAGGTSPYTYHWDNNVNGILDTAITVGLHYLVVVDSNNCIYNFSYTLPGLWPHVIAKPDTTIYYGSSIELLAEGAIHYKWWPNVSLNCDTCTRPVFSGLVKMHYCVAGTDSFGCMDTACIDIDIRRDCGIPFLPTGFTPNKDNVNDHFHVLGNCLNTAHLVIFNRWGQKIFESNSLQPGWDGNYNGVPCKEDVYIWILDATNLFGESFHLKGDVTLIR